MCESRICRDFITQPLHLDEVCYDATLGLVALRASLEEPFASLCQNQHPHITVAKAQTSSGNAQEVRSVELHLIFLLCFILGSVIVC